MSATQGLLASSYPVKPPERWPVFLPKLQPAKVSNSTFNRALSYPCVISTQWTSFSSQQSLLSCFSLSG